MGAILPLLLLSKSDQKMTDNTNLMMLMLMQQPNAIRDPSMLMPLILLKVKNPLKSSQISNGLKFNKLVFQSHLKCDILSIFKREYLGRLRRKERNRYDVTFLGHLNDAGKLFCGY